MNNFEYASRNKLRIETPVGLINVEQLWELPLQSKNKLCLDTIAQDLHKQIIEQPTSFVTKQVKSDINLKVLFDIVKYIIDTKLTEQDNAKNIQEKVIKRNKLITALANIEETEISSKSKEDIMKELNQLDNSN